jgi:hypothetical protein
MENKKQTAVELMYRRAISVLPMGAIDARCRIEETYHQALEMEKQQIMDAFNNGENKSAEIYYKEHTEVTNESAKIYNQNVHAQLL